MSMKRLDVIRIQELGKPVKDQTLVFWRKVLKELAEVYDQSGYVVTSDSTCTIQIIN